MTPLAGHADGAEEDDHVGDRVVGEQVVRRDVVLDGGAQDGEQDREERGDADDDGEGPGGAELEQLGLQQGVHDAAPVSERNASSRDRSLAARPRTATPSWPAISPTCSGDAPMTDRMSPARCTLCPRAWSAEIRRSGSWARTSVAGPSSPPSTCSSVPCARSWPPAMTTTSSTDSATSASTWLETRTAAPRAASARSRPRSQLMPGGSSPLVGSSRISTSGSPSSAAAMARRWRMPSE